MKVEFNKNGVVNIIFSNMNVLNYLRVLKKQTLRTWLIVSFLSVFGNVCAFAQQETTYTEEMVNGELQIMNYLLNKHVNYNKVYDARDFGLQAPDSLWLKTTD